MFQRYINAVCDYRYDPIMTGIDGDPVPPTVLPWLFPTSRVWIAALWFALVDPPPAR